ncbi:MAG: inositol 2-dehydrogenase [Spirosomataceae bacterium]
MNTIKLGLLGFGRIGKIHFANIQQRIKGVEIVMVADPIADLTQLPVAVGTAEEIIAHPEIDAVIICSPTDSHAHYIEQCALVGKHVFCEKPMDLSLERIVHTLRLVQERGIKLMLGFNRRFDANFLKVKHIIDSGEIGNTQVLKVTSRDPGPPPVSYLKESGGMFMDMTIHDFDMVRYLMNKEVKEVYASAAVFVSDEIKAVGDIDTAVITIKFEDDSMAVIDNSRKAVYGYDQRVEAFGSKGMVQVGNNVPDTHTLATERGIQSALPLHFFLERYMESYFTEMSQFVDALLRDTPIPVSGHDALKATIMALAAQKSVEENRPVLVSEIEAEFSAEISL